MSGVSAAQTKRLLAAMLFSSIFCACGGPTNNGIKLGTAPVQAQTMFSNSDISGGYAFLLNGELNSLPIAVDGMFLANGGTSITSGQASQHTAGTACQFTVTGSVNITNNQVNNNPSNGTGVLQLSMMPFGPIGSPSGSCSSETFIFNLVVASGAQELLLVQNGSSTPNITISGTATKQ